MHFTILISLFLCSLVLGSRAATNGDATPIVSAMQAISSALHGLTSNAQAYDGDAVKAGAILSDYEDMISLIGQRNQTIAQLDKMHVREAIAILEPAAVMIDDLNSLVAALVAKKPMFDASDFGPVVLDTFARGKVAAKAMIDTILLKLPPTVEGVGHSIGKQLTASLDKGIKAYSQKPKAS